VLKFRIGGACVLLVTLALGGPTSASTSASVPAPEARGDTTHVLAISIDALNPAALRKLGRERTPALHRLLDEGAFTLNARTQVESTETLPNHTSMVTGRRVLASRGGHGVDWNVHRPGTTVQQAAGHDVESVFTVAHPSGSTALFSAKEKFSIFKRSWDADLDRIVIHENDDKGLMRSARSDLVHGGREFTFVHFGHADLTGHAEGFMSPAYLAAVQQVDGLVGKLIQAIESHPDLAGTVVILTADHGGKGRSHYDPTKYVNYRIPFVVWGPGVSHGDLYAMNPSYADPGHRRVPYSGRQPIRNGDLANLALDLLGLGPVPDSKYDVKQLLSVS
jgi:predicted AlkP superfamily pyrophosphatase or phosphodiesterase